MAQLINHSKKITLSTSLEVARSFHRRALGLIGTKSMTADQAIWFPNCNWIHTMFMSIPIDVIYLDQDFRIHKLEPQLRPWKFLLPVWHASSVVEARAGFILDHNLEVGDVLHVGH